MYKLSPSDFAYLYHECKFCYYRKVKQNIYRPSSPMPGVFSAINTRIQGTLVGKNLQTLSNSLPDGEVVNQEGWVDSVLFPDTSVYIKGKYDLLVQNKDKTHTLVDLKLSQPLEEKKDKYETQLMAYKYALEHPRFTKPVHISSVGLLIFYPKDIFFRNEEAVLHFPPKWMRIDINEKKFSNFMKNVDDLLSGPEPKPAKYCKWCQYRQSNNTASSLKPITQPLPF